MPQRADVIVNPATGNYLIIHRRRIATESVLFIIGVTAFITARLVNNPGWTQALYSIGSLCFFVLICMLVWRFCCCCCCNHVKPGHVISGPPQAAPTGIQVPCPAPYPAAPAAMQPAPVANSYPRQNLPVMPTPPYPYGVDRQPAYNPNMPPSTLH